MPTLPSLVVRKLADTSVGERVKRYDPVTGEAYLADPETWDRLDPETWVEAPWPLAGIVVEHAPEVTEIPTSWVATGIAEGFVELENPRLVERPGGPPEHPWRVRHAFTHADAIVIGTREGDVRYRVLEQPDKWPERKNGRGEGFGGEVRWHYRVELER